MKRLALFLIVLLITACGGGGGTATVSESPSKASSTPRVTVKSAGSGQYAVTGENFQNVAGMKLTITYEGNGGTPNVVQGSMITDAPGALFIANPDEPGKVLLAAVQATGAFNGSGVIATLTFDTVSVKINSVAVELTVQESNGNVTTIPVTEVPTSIQGSSTSSDS